MRGHAPSATGVLDTGEGEVRGHASSATGVLDTGEGEVRGHAPSATGVLDTGEGEVRGWMVQLGWLGLVSNVKLNNGFSKYSPFCVYHVCVVIFALVCIGLIVL